MSVESQKNKASGALREINVGYIARVEGEGAIRINSEGGKISRLEVNVWEPPRFFEGFLVGRKYDEVPDLSGRICGICSTSHQLTSIYALEDAMGIHESAQTRTLRKLMALGSFIMNLAVHIYVLEAPDYFRKGSVFGLIPEHLEVVKKAIRIKRVGNELASLIGGRPTHPVSLVVGGFSSLPSTQALRDFLPKIQEIKQDALDTLRIIAGIKRPDFESLCEHVALSDPPQYAINMGNLVSTRGMNIPPEKHDDVFRSKFVPHSNALHYYVEGRDSFMVGALPRVNLNYAHLSADARKTAEESGLKFPAFNPFYGMAARAVELVSMVDEAVEILGTLKVREEKPEVKTCAGKGYAVTEAPRGALYHAYQVDEKGVVEFADIVTPTAHHVYNLEKDLWKFVPTTEDLPLDDATLFCEMLVRAYDPCFSCSVH